MLENHIHLYLLNKKTRSLWGCLQPTIFFLYLSSPLIKFYLGSYHGTPKKIYTHLFTYIIEVLYTFSIFLGEILLYITKSELRQILFRLADKITLIVWKKEVRYLLTMNSYLWWIIFTILVLFFLNWLEGKQLVLLTYIRVMLSVVHYKIRQ